MADALSHDFLLDRFMLSKYFMFSFFPVYTPESHESPEWIHSEWELIREFFMRTSCQARRINTRSLVEMINMIGTVIITARPSFQLIKQQE